MILPITVYGNPVLRKVAEDITPDYPDLEQLIADMFETMHFADGVGLAAPQIGKSIRLFVMDLSHMEEDFPELANFRKALINARIVEMSEDTCIEEEGCLSIPGIRENVNRSNQIRITYLDQDFVPHDEVYNGWPARVIQHEYDHLDGKLFVDKVSPIKRTFLGSKLSAISKGRVRTSYRIKL